MSLIILSMLLEGVSFFGLRILKEEKGLIYQPISFPLSLDHKEILQRARKRLYDYNVYDPALGWTIKANSHEVSDAVFHSNSSGIRSYKEYPLQKEKGKIRIAAFGDSFTHGDEVDNAQTWEAVMESFDSRIEVMNFGVGCYGPDQALLRYRSKGVRFNPEIVLIGFMPENIYRVVNVFRPFYIPNTAIPLSKPRFKIQNDQLVLIPNPLSDPEDIEGLLRDDRDIYKKIRAEDYHYPRTYQKGSFDFLATVRLLKILESETSKWFRGNSILKNGIYNTEGEAFLLTVRILDEFYEEASKSGAIPIILIFPAKEDMDNFVNKKEIRYAPLIGYLKSKKRRYIDLMTTIGVNYSEKETFLKTHYTPKGNRSVAQAVYENIKDTITDTKQLFSKTTGG